MVLELKNTHLENRANQFYLTGLRKFVGEVGGEILKIKHCLVNDYYSFRVPAAVGSEEDHLLTKYMICLTRNLTAKKSYCYIDLKR